MSLKTNKCLIITSSGGGGLLQAAVAKEQEIKEENSDVLIYTKDIMKDWVWRPIGWFFVEAWNRAQRGGVVWVQSFFCTVGPGLIDSILWPFIFTGTLRSLLSDDIDRVIDTQPFSTSATIKAIRLYNKLRNKKVILEKILVDLPTTKSTHFFWSIKHLCSKDRNHLKLFTIDPLLEAGQTLDDFWKKNCNLPSTNLEYQYFYVRKTFKKFLNKQRSDEISYLDVGYKSQGELDLILQSIQRGSAEYTVLDGIIKFSIHPTHRVFTILLGSQPSEEGILNYIKSFIAAAQEGDSASRTPTCLFIYCAGYNPLKPNLLSKAVEYIKQVHNYPPSLTIIPMTFQSDEIIAPMFFRSDMTCTRSGGQTVMELLCAGRGEIWIHSETVKNGRTLQDSELLKGISGWEAGNAVYLQKFKNAKLVTPDTIGSFAKGLLYT